MPGNQKYSQNINYSLEVQPIGDLLKSEYIIIVIIIVTYLKNH